MGALSSIQQAKDIKQEHEADSRQQTGNGKQKAVKLSHTVLSLTRLSLSFLSTFLGSESQSDSFLSLALSFVSTHLESES